MKKDIYTFGEAKKDLQLREMKQKDKFIPIISISKVMDMIERLRKTYEDD